MVWWASDMQRLGEQVAAGFPERGRDNLEHPKHQGDVRKLAHHKPGRRFGRPRWRLADLSHRPPPRLRTPNNVPSLTEKCAVGWWEPK
jgi:hypothetical protein